MEKRSILLSLISFFVFSHSSMHSVQIGNMEIQKRHVPAVVAAIFGSTYFLGMGGLMYRDHKKNKPVAVLEGQSKHREYELSILKNLCGGTFIAALVGGVVGVAANKIDSLYQKYGHKIVTVLMIFLAGYVSRGG